jgi:organic hydroperoxide reductase OsmC/OhrA
MSSYSATIRWDRRDAQFTDGQYSRAHQWEFAGGALVRGSASADHVPRGTTDPAGVNPEEALIAALSSCHMLFFLDFARLAGLVVQSYVDDAVGTLERSPEGTYAITRVTLRPRVTWAGDEPDAKTVAELYEQAHDVCFIANSVKTEVDVEY